MKYIIAIALSLFLVGCDTTGTGAYNQSISSNLSTGGVVPVITTGTYYRTYHSHYRPHAYRYYYPYHYKWGHYPYYYHRYHYYGHPRHYRYYFGVSN